MASRTVSIILTGNNASAVRAIEGTSTAAAKAGGVVESKMGGAAQKVGGAFTKLDHSLAGFGLPFAGALGVVGAKLEQTETKTKSFAGSLASVGGAELIAGAAGLALVGGEALKMADAFDQAHAKLAVSVHNVGQSLSTESDAIKGADERLTDLGFKSSETEAALAKLVPAAGSVGKATELMGVAADLARFKNQSLGDATQTLVNIEGGRLRVLASLGISSKDAAGKTISTAEAIRRVTAVVSGQGSAYLDTYAGKLALAGAKSEELGVKLGELEKVAIGGLVDKGLTIAHAFETVNSALDGIPGKALAIAAVIPAGVFIVEKLAAAWGHVAEAAGLAATAEQGAGVAGAEAGAAGAAGAGGAAVGAGEAGAGLGLGGIAAAGGGAAALAGLSLAGTALGDLNLEKRGHDFGLLGTAATGAAKGIASIIPGGTQVLGLFGLLTGSGEKHTQTEHKVAAAAVATEGAFYQATSGVDALAKAFDALEGKAGSPGPLAKADEAATIADKFDAVNTAKSKVAADKADVAGTSRNAQEADRAEADALRGLRDANVAVSDSHQRLSDSYVTLQDAQDRVKTSADGLLRAQEALDKFNSPRGAQERALQLDQIQRTVATTPSQEDAKQLSLLQFQDQNENQKQSLTDAVINAQKGVRDANRGVKDAQRGIADAERGIVDATQKVADAQQNVSDAVTKRKAVHDDAAKAIVADERAVHQAVNAVATELKKAHDAGLIANDQLANYLTLLRGVADEADPGGPLAKNLDSLIGKMQLSAVLAQKIKDDAAKGSGPTSFGNGSSGPSPTPPAATTPPAPTFPVIPVGPGGPSGYPVRAEGGPVAAHTKYKVGEVGAELFVAKTETVVPKAALAASVAYKPAAGMPGAPGYGAAGTPGVAGAAGRAEASAFGAPGLPGVPGEATATAGKAGTAGLPGAPGIAHVSVAAAASAALKGEAAPHPDKMAPRIVGAKGPEIFVPPVAGTIIPHDKLAQTAAGVPLKGYAEGGPVDPYKRIVVGEKGPEVFVPKSAGSVQSLRSLAAPTSSAPAPNVTTFANTYHINAHDNPTRAELDAINREQAWQLTRSGRR